MPGRELALPIGVITAILLVSLGEHYIVFFLSGGRVGSLSSLFDALPGKWKIIVIGMAPIVLLAIAFIVKHIEVWHARNWLAVPGKIIGSRSVQRKVERSASASSDEDHEMRNFADIAYSYEVAGRKLRGSRVGIASDLGNSRVAETLARYKIGTAVTVYYDPKNPETAVIERTLGAGSFKLGLYLISGLTAALFAVVFGAGLLRDGLRGVIQAPGNASIVTFLAIFAAAVAWFAFAMSRQAAAVGGWGTTKGRIRESETESFRAGSPQTSSRQHTAVRQRVTYSYSVAGVAYSSDRVSMGARTTSSLRGLEQAIVRRYPVGATVTVYYDPANPSQAVLERGARLLWVMWATAAVLAAAAVIIAIGPATA